MTDVEVAIDDMTPGHMVVVAVDGDTVQVTVSSHVEAATLAALDPAIGLAVAEVVQHVRDERAET
jgi:hypothetical protein